MIQRDPLLTASRRYLVEAFNAYYPDHGYTLIFVPQDAPAGAPLGPFVTLYQSNVEPDGILSTLDAKIGNDPGQVATFQRSAVQVTIYGGNPGAAYNAARAWHRSSRGGVWCARRKIVVRNISPLILTTDELNGAGARLRGDFTLTIAQGSALRNIGADAIKSVDLEVIDGN